jgi:hypothetical protein
MRVLPAKPSPASSLFIASKLTNSEKLRNAAAFAELLNTGMYLF